MYRTLLVPLDGSDFAEDALPMAKLLARKLGAEMHLVHVIRPSTDTDFKTPQEDLEWREGAREGVDGYLKALAVEARSEELSALTATLEGRALPQLRDYIQEQDVDIVVLTSHGAGGVQRWWLGSVADGLVRTADADLLVVRPWDETEDREPASSRFGRIVVPLDGSELAETALEPARELASRFDSRLTLLRVVPAPIELTSIYGVSGVEVSGRGHKERLAEAKAYLDALVENHPEEGLEARVVQSASPADGIVSEARELGADLIVISSHGRGGFERVVLGSVADKVVRSTTRPVLVVRGREEED